MKKILLTTISMLLLICSLFSQTQQTALPGESAATNANSIVPPMVRFSGTLNDATGKPLSGVVGVTFALYQEE
jgi:hypothetical protein